VSEEEDEEETDSDKDDVFEDAMDKLTISDSDGPRAIAAAA
jgi:hypothetical protein